MATLEDAQEYNSVWAWAPCMLIREAREASQLETSAPAALVEIHGGFGLRMNMAE